MGGVRREMPRGGNIVSIQVSLRMRYFSGCDEQEGAQKAIRGAILKGNLDRHLQMPGSFGI